MCQDEASNMSQHLSAKSINASNVFLSHHDFQAPNIDVSIFASAILYRAHVYSKAYSATRTFLKSNICSTLNRVVIRMAYGVHFPPDHYI